ncbi:MAG: hypothetical protein A2284_18215 [Deltaproteobacteria bacterium RIFOXYA12_FULL_61_11]|nr:MAG: hypothetical protein A2284_18215 [Deltaproteobacteria bacterium RIFOXYA12_FULL_61_11]
MLLRGSVHLVRTVWSEKRGARNLFAAHSDIPDQYLWFERQLSNDYHWHWEAEEPSTTYLSAPVSVNYDQYGRISFSTGGYWMLGAESLEDGQTVYTVTDVLNEDQVVSFGEPEVDASAEGVTVILQDNSPYDYRYDDTFALKLLGPDWVGLYHTRQELTVPRDQVVRDEGQRFTITLPMAMLNEDVQKAIEKGKELRAEVTVTRNLDGHQALVTVDNLADGEHRGLCGTLGGWSDQRAWFGLFLLLGALLVLRRRG